jgi:hypothetical protein
VHRTPRQSLARQLIDEAIDLDAEDLAADFIETVVGRFHFDETWKKRRDIYSKKLQDWLAKRGNTDKFEEVVKLIDHLATGNFAWNDRWSDDYGGERDKPPSTKPTKPKPKKNVAPIPAGRQVPPRRLS